MTDLEYLKEQDKLGDKHQDNKLGHHIHICDFELLGKIYGHKNNWSKRKCKKYLKLFGKKRDLYLSCCDRCPHMRYVDINKDDFVLSITTVGIGRSYNFLDKEMVERI